MGIYRGGNRYTKRIMSGRQRATAWGMRREAANDVGKMKSKSQIERNKCKKWLDKPIYNNISNNYNKNNYNTRHQQQLTQ